MIPATSSSTPPLTNVLNLICSGMASRVVRFEVGQEKLSSISGILDPLKAGPRGSLISAFDVTNKERGVIQFTPTIGGRRFQRIPIKELEEALGVKRLPDDCTVEIKRITSSLWNAPTPPQALIETFSALRAAGARLEFKIPDDKTHAFPYTSPYSSPCCFTGSMKAIFNTEGLDLIFNTPVSFQEDGHMIIDGKEGPRHYKLVAPGRNHKLALSLAVLLGNDLKNSPDGYDRLMAGLTALLEPMVSNPNPFSVRLQWHPPKNTWEKTGELELSATNGRQSARELHETEKLLQMDSQGTYLGNIPAGYYLARSYTLKPLPPDEPSIDIEG